MPAPSVPEALPAAVASWVTTTTPAWLARTKRTVHLASRTVFPRPWPFQSNLGRKRKPASRRYGIIARAWTTRPSSVPMPSSRTPSSGMTSTPIRVSE